MKIYDAEEHQNCFCYDRKEKPLVELLSIEQNDSIDFTLNTNEIVLVLSGKLLCNSRDNPGGEITKKDLVFLPVGDKIQCTALKKSEILLFRLMDSANLCYNFSLTRLFNETTTKEQPKSISPLKANIRLWYFAKGLIDVWEDGLRCRNFLKMEISKLLTMLPIYYSKHELYMFYYPALSPDVTFSEYVRVNHLKYRTIIDLAASLNLTSQQFTRRFKVIFGQAPHEWMQRERARLIYGEICQTNKPLKEIATEYGFTDQANFYRFCKAFYTITPREVRLSK